MTTLKTINVSPSGIQTGGDIIIGRGQLGLLASITYQSDASTAAHKNLWDTSLGDIQKPTRFLINADNQTGTKEVYLPDVGTAGDQAQSGHLIYIKNIGSVSFNIKNIAATSIYDLPSDSYVELVANSAEANDWTITHIKGSSGSGTLQEAYNASTSPEITLNTTNKGLSIINDATDAAHSMFSVADNSNTKNYFNVITTFGTNSVLTGLGNNDVFGKGITTAAIDSVALGIESSANVENGFAFGAGAIAISDGSIAIGTNSSAGGSGCVAIGSDTLDIKGNGASASGVQKVSTLLINNGEGGGNYENAGVGRYFLLHATLNRAYYVWFNTDGGSTDPNISSRIGIEVSISSGFTANLIATATRTALNATRYFSASGSLGTVTITRSYGSATTNDTDGNLGSLVTIVNDTPGTLSTGSIAIGQGSKTTGMNSLTVGYNSSTTSNAAINVGATNTASGLYSIILGHGSTASTATSSAVIGKGGTVSTFCTTLITSGENFITVPNNALYERTLVKAYSRGERLISGSIFPGTTGSSPSIRWVQGSATSIGTNETNILNITLPADTGAGIEYKITGIVNSTGTSTFSPGDLWYFTVGTSAKYDGTDTFVNGDGGVAGNPVTSSPISYGETGVTINIKGTAGGPTVGLYVITTNGGTLGRVYWTVTASVTEVTSLAF